MYVSILVSHVALCVRAVDVTNMNEAGRAPSENVGSLDEGIQKLMSIQYGE